jgi:hypothetical protein
MLIQINDKQRIVSNPCGGFDLQELDVVKETKEPRLTKDGKQRWKFRAYMPTLDKLMMVVIMESEAVTDKTMGDITQILDAIRTAKEECLAAVEAVGL